MAGGGGGCVELADLIGRHVVFLLAVAHVLGVLGEEGTVFLTLRGQDGAEFGCGSHACFST